MPVVIDEPGLRFTKSLFEGASPVPGNLDPQAQLGAWAVWQIFLQKFEQTFIWPATEVRPDVRQSHRAFVTTVLLMGENLLTMPLRPQDKEAVELTVRSYRDKLVLEFAEATPEQSESTLSLLFGEGALAD